LAKTLGVTPQAVSQWVLGRRKLPPLQAIKIQNKVGIPKEKLRPDFPWEKFLDNAQT
jgi:DNA-binding transcriptional regulator YdaS (Cro superfamily)